MLGKSPDQQQFDLFRPVLKQIVNPNHELVVLSKQIDWVALEQELSPLYSQRGAPSKPIRLVAGLLMLKRIYNLGDETVVAAWIQNPYYQYFCGEQYFQWEQPCDPSDLVHFRKRIGEEGVKRLFEESIKVHGEDAAKGNTLLVDTTAQENNITYPTDAKLYRKIIIKCNALAGEAGVQMRQTYTRTVKGLLLKLRFGHHPKRRRQATKALRKLKTIAGRQVRDLERKLEKGHMLTDAHLEFLGLCQMVLEQSRNSKDKFYSLHEPQTACIAKGKSGKPYEFGSKVSVGLNSLSGVILSILNFTGNPHDSKTLTPTLDEVHENTGKWFEQVLGDRAYRGRKKYKGSRIMVPGQEKGKDPTHKRKLRKLFRQRAAIEPIIGHLKSDHRLGRNYLKGIIGDQINPILAAMGFNLKLKLNQIRERIFYAWIYWIQIFNLKSGFGLIANF